MKNLEPTIENLQSNKCTIIIEIRIAYHISMQVLHILTSNDCNFATFFNGFSGKHLKIYNLSLCFFPYQSFAHTLCNIDSVYINT